MTIDEQLDEVERLVHAGELEEAWRLRREILHSDACSWDHRNRSMVIRLTWPAFYALCEKLDEMVHRLTS